MSGVIVDVTQFSRQPARSGVQRALGETARAWPQDDDALFMARVGEGLRGLTPAGFSALVQQHFDAPDQVDGVREVQAAFAAGRRLREAQVDDAVLLLPEPTYDPEVLGDLAGRLRRGQPVAGVAYDCFPQTHPWAFAGNGQVLTSPYYRLLASLPLVVATSGYVHRVLVDRLRRTAASSPTVWLGTDHVSSLPALGERAPGDVVVVGTVEPRKRVPLALAAVDLLRQDDPRARLVVIGRPGVEEPAFLRRLRQRSLAGDGVLWVEDADDDVLTAALRRATVLLAVGDEGYGLPAVEAAAHGTGVVHGGEQPAAGLLEGRGAWAADISSASVLAEALRPWLDDGWARARRALIDVSGLPTWSGFARELHDEVARLA